MNKYQRKLHRALRNHYTEEQIELFKWNPDVNEKNHYSLNFIDHTNKEVFLKMVKSGGFSKLIK
jgi:hypothetical protein